MYEENFSLSINDILEKEFKIDARGYRPQEVDKFLDIIIRDYSEFKTAIKRKNADIMSLENEISSLQNEIRKLKSQLDIVNSSEKKNVTNVDIIKRLSELEKIVYGTNE